MVLTGCIYDSFTLRLPAGGPFLTSYDYKDWGYKSEFFIFIANLKQFNFINLEYFVLVYYLCQNPLKFQVMRQQNQTFCISYFICHVLILIYPHGDFLLTCS